MTAAVPGPTSPGRVDPAMLPERTVLPAQADAAFDRFAALTRRVIDAPTALVSLVDRDRQAFPGASGLPADVARARQTPLTHSFCKHVVAESAALVITDARVDPRLATNGAIADLGVVAYAGMPIVDRSGRTVGSLCAIDTEPRVWSEDELANLEDLAAACSAEIQLRQTADEARETAAALARVIATMPVGYLHLDRDWRIEELNHEAARLVRRDRRNLIGRLLRDAFPTLVGAAVEAALAGDSEPDPHESFSAAIAGRWFEFRAIREDDGVSVYFVDVTARHEVNDLLVRQAEHDRSVAHALQEVLLTAVPTVPGFTLAARYATAAVTEQVGGDWYDAVVQPDGTLTSSIGDVCGHDIGAAAIMGQLRAMLRGFLWNDHGTLAANITRLDEAARGLGTQALATLVTTRIGVPGPDGRRLLTWSNAGHPPPVLVLPDGTTEILDRPADLMVGVRPGIARHEESRVIEPGTALLLYTDGLIETRQDSLDDGIERVRAALSRHRTLPPDGLLDALLAEVHAESRTDDIAMLLVRVDGPDDPHGP